MKLYSKILNITNTINRDNVFVYASQAAFFIIIASIPSIMMLLSLAKFFLPVSKDYLMTVANPLRHISTAEDRRDGIDTAARPKTRENNRHMEVQKVRRKPKRPRRAK